MSVNTVERTSGFKTSRVEEEVVEMILDRFVKSKDILWTTNIRLLQLHQVLVAAIMVGPDVSIDQPHA